MNSDPRHRPRPGSAALRADLHIHTTASDGRWTPERVVEGCRALGIGLFAVADHDSVDNVLPTEALALQAGLSFLRCVEISTMTSDANPRLMLHILGYGVDPDDPALEELLEANRIKMEIADDGDIHGLIEQGYDIDFEDYAKYEYDRTRGGFKSLNYCIDLGLCTGPRDFFDRIRSQINAEWPDFVPPEAAVAAIRGAGGVPVLAHPGGSLGPVDGVTEATLASMLEYGIEGFECYSQYHDDATTAICVDWCAAHDLIITGGSDYHGGFVGRELGVPVVDTSQLRLGALAARIRRP